MSVSRHVPVFVGGLALAAASFLALDEARARNECGALVSGAATCSDQAYANGIRYDTGNGFNAGIAGPVTLTVTGGPATTITGAPSSIQSWARGGIIVRAGPQGSGDSTSRNIALTVGSGSNAVAIVERASVSNDGVNVDQHGTAADGTTVTLGSGVTIGTSSAPMGQYGVSTIIYDSNNSGVHSITSAATIQSVEIGLLLGTNGSGNVFVTNTGSITTSATGGRTANSKHGILVFDWSHRPQDLEYGGTSRTVDTMTTVMNSGSITVSHAEARGIKVDAHGLGLYRIVNSGSGAQGITASGANGSGVFVDARYHTGAAGSAAVEIENSGRIETSGASGYGVYVETVGGEEDAFQAEGQHKGNVAITNSGSISSANHAIFVNADMGAVSVTHSGGSITSTAADGIRVQQVGTGTVTVESSADIEAENYGIVLSSSPTVSTVTVAAGTTTYATPGDVSVTHSGGEIEAKTESGIRVEQGGADATVASSADITARKYGIFVTSSPTTAATVAVAAGTTTTTYATPGDTTVTHSGGEIEARTESGIRVEQGGADATVTSSADVTARKYGIFVTNNPALATRMVTAAGVTTDTWSTTGAVSVTHSAGTVSAQTEAGIGAENSAGNADAVTVAVTGGAVKSDGQGKPAIQVLQRGTGAASVSVSSGAVLASKDDAGIYARIGHADNAAGRIVVTQGGAVSGDAGVRAEVLRASAAGETRAAAAQPLIDITWTGTFSHRTTAAAAGSGGARVTASGSGSGVAGIRPIALHENVPEAETGKATRYGTAAGIEAHAMSWRAAAKEVAKGDDPGAFADAAAQAALFDAGAGAVTRARAATVLAAFRTQLAADPRAIPDVDSVDANDDDTHTDAEIRAYLTADSADRRTFLRNILVEHLSEKETAVLRAVVTDTGLDAALDDAEAGFSADYKAAVRALLERHNIGDIRIAMDGGSIAASRGDGIRAYYATPHAMNGAISVTVAAGATVEGDVAGVYVANAGTGLQIARKYTPPDIHDAEANEGLGPDDLVTLEAYRNQVVRVDGTVTGGTDAAVHLNGGGALIVGRTGKVVAGSRRPAVLVNDPGPAVVYIDGEVTGSAGADAAVHLTGGGSVTFGLTGRVRANGATLAVRVDRPDRDDTTPAVIVQAESGQAARFTRESVEKALERIDGPVGGNNVGGSVHVRVLETVTMNGREVTTGYKHDAELDARGNPTVDRKNLQPEIGCEYADDERCRLYEALPSALLEMNGLPNRAERMSAARDGAGGWALVEAAAGKWTAGRATTQAKLAFDHSRYGVRAGVDMAAGEDARLGLAAHGFRGSAKTPSSGEAKLSGVALGVYAAAMLGDGVHVDAQAAATWFDVDVDAPLARKDDVKGRGYAVGLEVGRRMSADAGVSLTPRAGLLWSSASLGSFEEVSKINAQHAGAAVAVKDATRLTGTVGVSVESVVDDGARLFGAIDVSHEFSGKTETSVSGTALKSSPNKTTLRVGVGSLIDLGDGASLRGSVGYATAGGGNNELRGGLSLDMRF